MSGLLFIIPSLRARSNSDGNFVLVKVLNKLDDAGERAYSRPERVLLNASLVEISVEGELRWKIGEEGE